MIYIDGSVTTLTKGVHTFISPGPTPDSATLIIEDTGVYKYKIFRLKQLSSNKSQGFFMEMRGCSMGQISIEPTMTSSTTLDVSPGHGQ